LFEAWLAAETADDGPQRKIRMPADVLPWLKKFAKRKTESFVVVTLNGAHEVIRTREVSRGLVNRTLTHPREVFEGAIRDRAVAIVIAHNHPSGNTQPSNEDHEVTRRMAQAGEFIGIRVLDSVIVTKVGYYSFLEQGRM
jgi:DNA repair protein RadC